MIPQGFKHSGYLGKCIKIKDALENGCLSHDSNCQGFWGKENTVNIYVTQY